MLFVWRSTGTFWKAGCQILLLCRGKKKSANRHKTRASTSISLYFLPASSVVAGTQTFSCARTNACVAKDHFSHDTHNTAHRFLPALSGADDPRAGQPEPNQQVAPGSLRAPPSPPALQESTAPLYSRLLRPLFRLLSPPFCASLNVHKGLFWGGGHSIRRAGRGRRRPREQVTLLD